MTFEEKSTWAVAVVTVLVYGWYFIKIIGDAASTPVAEIEYQGLLASMVGVFVVLLIVSHVVITGVAAATTGGIEGSDVRDQEIGRFGEYVGGTFLAVGMLLPFALALIEAEHFWIANAIYLVFALYSIIGTSIKLVAYRRGL